VMYLSALLFLAFVGNGEAAERSPKVRAAFMQIHPCPATGKTRGRCDGWNVDHRIPICYDKFGLDVVSNMQWLTIEQHREKTKLDVKVCKWDGK